MVKPKHPIKLRPQTVSLSLVLSLALVFFAGLSVHSSAGAKERTDVRFYRVNKDGIGSRFWFTRKKAGKLGCHNILKKSRLHRAVQFGYQSCQVFRKKDCAADSIVSFSQDEVTNPESVIETDISQGYSWFPVGEHKRGERIKSWECFAKSKPENKADS